MTEEFHEWRGKGIGASDIAGILGISPWASPYSVWASKVIQAPYGDSGGTETMRWGKLLEDAIIAEAGRRIGAEVYGHQTRCEHPDYPWARATVDAFGREISEENQSFRDNVIEAKVTSDYRWQDIPEYYEAQVLWQLEVTGLHHGWLAALHGGRKLSLWYIPENKLLQSSMIDVARKFWEEFVVPQIPPMIDGKEGTTELINAFYASSDKGTSVELDAYRDELTALGRVRRDIKKLEADEAALTNKIKAALGRAEIGDLDGRPVVTWKAHKSKHLDLAMIREKYPREVAECETVKESRRFLTKKLPLADAEV